MSVVVMGSLHLDLMIEADALPRLGETAVGRSWGYKPGGKGGNQAVAAAQHEAQVAMLGLVGSDDFGDRLRRNLRAHGVNASGVLTREGVGSGMSIAITEASGDYGAMIVSGANLLVDQTALSPSAGILAACSCLLLQNEVSEAANIAAAQMAHAGAGRTSVGTGGARVLLNAAPARALPGELLAQVDILIVNALEAEVLCGTAVDGLEAAKSAAGFLLDRVPCAVVTAGGAGLAYARRDGARLALPAHPVRVASTHGAGDAFVGALAARLDAGDTMEDALRYANAAAALTVATPDEARAQLGLEAVRHFMRQSGDAE